MAEDAHLGGGTVSIGRKAAIRWKGLLAVGVFSSRLERNIKTIPLADFARCLSTPGYRYLVISVLSAVHVLVLHMLVRNW